MIRRIIDWLFPRIKFENPSPYKVWRSGERRAGKIIVPNGYEITWKILSNRFVVFSSVGSQVDYTFTYLGMDHKNSYDLYVRAEHKNRRKALHLYSQNEFIVLPQIFDACEASAIVNFKYDLSQVDGVHWPNR